MCRPKDQKAMAPVKDRKGQKQATHMALCSGLGKRQCKRSSDVCKWKKGKCKVKKSARFLEEEEKGFNPSFLGMNTFLSPSPKQNIKKKMSKSGRMAAKEEEGWNARKVTMPEWKQHQIGIETCKPSLGMTKRFLANKMFVQPMGYKMHKCSDTKYSANEMVVVSKTCGDFSKRDLKVLSKLEDAEKKELNSFLEMGEGLSMMEMMLDQLHHHALGEVVGDAHGEMLHGVMAHLAPLFNEAPGGLAHEHFQTMLQDVSSQFSTEDIPEDQPLHKLMSEKMLSFIEEMSSTTSLQDLDETMEGMAGTETDMELLLEILFWGLVIFLFGGILMKIFIFLISVGFLLMVIGLVILIVVLTLIVNQVWHMFDFRELGRLGSRLPGASLLPVRARARVEQHLASKMLSRKTVLL